MELEAIAPELQQRRTLHVHIRAPEVFCDPIPYTCGGNVSLYAAFDKLKAVFLGMQISHAEFRMFLEYEEEKNDIEILDSDLSRTVIDFVSSLEDHYARGDKWSFMSNPWVLVFQIEENMSPETMEKLENAVKVAIKKQEETFNLSFNIRHVLQDSRNSKLAKIDKRVCTRTIVNM